MLTEKDRRYIHERAHIPEHLPGYVQAVADAEPHLTGEYLSFTRKHHLTFIGYPLRTSADDAHSVYQDVCRRFRPKTVSLIAPHIWIKNEPLDIQGEDVYYRLDLPVRTIRPDVAYMVRRAKRDVHIKEEDFTGDHKKLITTFLSTREFPGALQTIYKRIPIYIKQSSTVRLLGAHSGGRLVAFNVLDLGSADYAFYLFNIRSHRDHIPGASDLLFHEMVRLAEGHGKRALNLGLGINAGIRRFKEKWGGRPFLPYCSAVVQRKAFEVDSLMKKL